MSRALRHLRVPHRIAGLRILRNATLFALTAFNADTLTLGRLWRGGEASRTDRYGYTFRETHSGQSGRTVLRRRRLWGGGDGQRRKSFYLRCWRYNRRFHRGGKNDMRSGVRRRFPNRRSFTIMQRSFRKGLASQRVARDEIRSLGSPAPRLRRRHATRILHIAASRQPSPSPRVLGHPLNSARA